LPGEAFITCSTSATAVCRSNAFALFRQQPRVLDSGDRLIGEGADKFDLPIDERLDPAPP
jgi:hypothetical protein